MAAAVGPDDEAVALVLVPAPDDVAPEVVVELEVGADDIAAADVRPLEEVELLEPLPHPPSKMAAIAVNTAIRIRIIDMFAHRAPRSCKRTPGGPASICA